MKLSLRFLPALVLSCAAVVTARAEQITITEIMYNPAGAKPEYIEIKNISSTPRDIAKWTFSAGVTYQFPDFNSGSTQAHILLPGEKIIVSSSDAASSRAAYTFIPAGERVFGPWVGNLDNSGERITLDDKNGVTQATVKYSNGGRWAKAADGTGHSLRLINENNAPDDWHNWKASSQTRGAGGPVTTAADFGSVWEWNIPASDPGTGWRTTTGGGWSSGPGLLGFETATLPAPQLQTAVGTSGSAPITYLFRRSFTYSGATAGATVAIDQIVDDGVIYYLNGNLLGASRVTVGGAWNSSATAGIGDAALESGVISGAATGLVSGTNVLSAELHQAGANGSDMVFGARVIIGGASSGGGAASSATLRISEVHFGANGSVDWVEVQNYTGTSQSAAGLFLSSKADFSNKVALTGSVNANGYFSWTVNFAPDASGNVNLYLLDGASNVMGPVAEVTRLAGRDSVQAVYPVLPSSKPTWQLLKTNPEWVSSTTATQNAANNPALTSSIVINEIMFDPMSDQDHSEFIELFNKSGGAVTLTGWKLRGGVDFDFPAGTSIPANGYLVVGGNKAFLQTAYAGATIVGNWSGRLSNKGDYIRLVDQNDNLADEVDYMVGGDWPDMSAKRGSSIELINPNMDNNRASAWRASDESNKSSFATLTVTGTYQQLFNPANGDLGSWGAQPSDYKEWSFRMPKDSEIIVKNMSLTPSGGGGNLLQNPTTRSSNGSSSSGWLCQGNHAESFFSGAEFHVVSDGHGEHKFGKVELDCTGINQGQSYTMTFEARWVSGAPTLIGELWDHSIGKVWHLDVPNNLGTAGAQNSRYNGSAFPQVDSLIHSPAVPKSNQSVKVTARVYSSGGISAVDLFTRADDINTGLNGNNYGSISMVDNGTNGDAVSGDGVYTATVTNHQSNNRIVQFYVRATGNGQQSFAPVPGQGRPAMWMVDDRTVNSDLRRQRFIMSDYDRDALRCESNPFGAPKSKYGYKYPRLQNHYFPMTFISNENDVYYLGEMRSGGSRWHRDANANMERAKWRLPSDRTFRMREKTNYDVCHRFTWAGGMSNQVQGYLLYLLGYPASPDEETAYTMFNSDNIEARIDKELTDNDLINRSFKDGGEGELYEMLEEYWVKDDYGDSFRYTDWLYKNTDDPIRYHAEFQTRSKDAQYDYSPLTDLLKTINNGSTTQEQMNRTVDGDLTLMVAAVRGSAADWDGAPLMGKNGCIYRVPSNDRMALLFWDGDSGYESDGRSDQFKVAGDKAGWRTYLDKPYNRRLFNYYLTELATKWTKSSPRTDAWFEAIKNSYPASIGSFTFSQAGVSQFNPSESKNYYMQFFSDRQNSLFNEINSAVGGGPGGAYSAGFSVSSPGSGGSTGSATVNLTGTAPSSAYKVVVDGHPEVTFSWSNQTTWALSGLILKTGSNAFTLRMLDRIGGTVGSTIVWNYNKTGNTAPVMDLDINPGSYNVTLGQLMTIDAGASFDPDGNAFTYSWSNTPNTGVSVTHPTPSTTNAVFTTPGIYSFTVTGTDTTSTVGTLTREVAVASSDDFATFSTATLESYWTVTGMENRDSAALSKWFSLDDQPGKLVIQVHDTSAKPLSHATPNHPLLLRTMPASTDCAILTDVSVEARKMGTYSTGLYLMTNEAEGAVEYAFGLDNGTQISAKRLTSGGIANVSGSPQASVGADAKLRIRRAGAQLLFQRRTNGVWSTLFTQNMTGAQTLSKGGIFLATTQAENARVAFDYVMVVDPQNPGSGLINNLKITEVMYHPLSPDTVEFIELKNVGTSALNLNGAHFDDGDPVTGFTFGNVPMNPGAYVVVTNSSSAFAAKYGSPAGVTIVQWPGGSLSNSGEQITLRDVDGNLIHSFKYDTVAPWPTAADGTGPSMRVVNVIADYENGANWTAGTPSPGTAGSVSGPDADGDGMSDAAEAMFGTNPNSPGSRAVVSPTRNGSNQAVLGFPTVSGRQYRVEYCDSLGGAWQTLGTITANGATWSYTDTTSPVPAKRFYHIVAL